MTTTTLPLDTKAMEAARQEQARTWAVDGSKRSTYANSRPPTAQGRRQLLKMRREMGL